MPPSQKKAERIGRNVAESHRKSSQKDARTRFSKVTFDRMASLLHQHVDELKKTHAFCYRHNMRCPVDGAPSGRLTFAVAGASCVEFSSMGHGRHFTGKTATVFLSYLIERRCMEDEAFFLVENVPSFADYADLILQYLPGYTVHVVIMSPNQFGYPNTRRRCHMLFLNEAKGYTMRKPFNDKSISAFFRSVVLDGDCFFIASADQVSAHVNESMRAQGDQCGHGDGDLRMPVGARMRLEGHILSEARA